jgi:hypothetical protein
MSKLTDMINRILGRNKSAKNLALKVGIMGDKTYPDGQKVSFVGYVNEYGYKGIVPSRYGMVYHKLDKDGNIANGGRFVKESKASIERQVVIPDYELNIPSRPFFRTAIANNKEALKVAIARAIREGDATYAARIAGEFMTDALKESVMTWSDPSNAKSTIRQKGYNAPLRGPDKLLRNSFTYEIEE